MAAKSEETEIPRPTTNKDGEGFDLRSISVEGQHYINYRLAPEEYLLECPYDTSHRIRPCRIHHHLYRCRKNYAKAREDQNLPPEDLIQCKFDKAHWIQPIEVEFHAKQCSYKDSNPEDTQRYITVGAVPIPKDPNAEREMEMDPEYYEWLPDPRCRSYDPSRKLREEPIYYQPSLMNKTEKKKYQAEQREKFYRTVSGPVWSSYMNEAFDDFATTGQARAEAHAPGYVRPDNIDTGYYDIPRPSSRASSPPTPPPRWRLQPEPAEEDHIVFVSSINDLRDQDSKDRN